MSVLLYILLFLAFIYCTISWVLPKILAFYIERNFRAKCKIGCIYIPSFSLCDISISIGSYTIHIEEISFNSRFLNSEVTKLLTCVIRDVRIHKDFVKVTDSSCNIKKTVDNDQPLDFRTRRVPHYIPIITQFMAISIRNVSAMFLHTPPTIPDGSPGWLLHAHAAQLHIDGSVIENQRLLVNVGVAEASAKVLRHPAVKLRRRGCGGTKEEEGGEEEEAEETCLGELSLALGVTCTVVAQGELSVDKLGINIMKTNATIKDEFYSLIQETQPKPSDPAELKRNSRKIIYKYISPIIPKKLEIKIEETRLRGMRENSRTDFTSSLQLIQLVCRIGKLEGHNEYPNIFSSLNLRQLKVQSTQDNVLILQKLGFDAKLEKQVISLNVALHSLNITYDHNMIYKWVSTNFLQNKSKVIQLKQESLRSNEESALLKFMNTFSLNICAEFNDIKANVKLNVCSYIGLVHTKIMLTQADRSGFLMGCSHCSKHWQTQCLVESFWWSKEPINTFVNDHNVHKWGIYFYLGRCLVQFEKCDLGYMKTKSACDDLQLEWSALLSEYILLSLICLNEYRLHKMSKKRIKQDTADKINFDNIGLELNLTNINCFFLMESNDHIVSHLKIITLEKNTTSTNLRLQAFKIFKIARTSGYYDFLLIDQVTDFKTFIAKIHLELRDGGRRCDVTAEHVLVYWSPNIHLTMLTIARNVIEFKERFVKGCGLDSVTEKRSSARGDSGGGKVAVGDIVVFRVHVYGQVALHVELERHKLQFIIDEMDITKTKHDLTVSNNQAMLSIDDDQIFTLDGLRLGRIRPPSNQSANCTQTMAIASAIAAARRDNEYFESAWNNPWLFQLRRIRVVFPYVHAYAEAVQGEAISVFKWLKIIHDVQKKDFTVYSPLPSDVMIQVDEFCFETSDDPFEVKLRDNYELLVDEYHESVKRRKKLKTTVDGILHLSSGKVEELYAKLKQRNAEVYIKRSIQMQSAARTRLFAWSMTNVEIMILADKSIHGTENVVRIMREIDIDSPWPDEGLQFSTLWCRVVSFRCQEWKFQLRDFPQPLLDIHNCHIFGQLIGAEQIAPKRAKRDVVINLGEPWGNVTIERGLLPLKFYHDFNCEIDNYSYAFGPCWEPVIAQCNYSFDKISPPSSDPSPPLPFWDKIRLLFHGRFTMVVQRFTVLLHASLDPYNTTEEMALTWNQVVMDWTNGKFIFKGDLNIFVRTASKYDDCQLLHLPNLKLVVAIKWGCLSNPNDHHNVIHCAPNKIPEYSSNQVHDSFRAFRSQNVNLRITMETKPIPNQPLNTVDCPTLSLYGSTLRWFENLKFILSGVTRPTKRGRIFNNIQPRKIQLSRHYKNIRFWLGLHKFQVCYWMSCAMQKGCELLGGRVTTSSEHTLSLVPIQDGLKHRPKAEWSIMYMNSDLTDAEIWLKSALDQDTEVMSMRQPVEKLYCLSVATVSYCREDVLPELGADRDRNAPLHRLVVYDLKGAWTKSNRNVAMALFDTFMKNQQMKKNLSNDALKSFRTDGKSNSGGRRPADCPGTPPSQVPVSGPSNSQSTSSNAFPSAVHQLVGVSTDLPTDSAVGKVSSSASVSHDTPSPMSKVQSRQAFNMLQQLIAEAENKAVVFSDDLSSATRQQPLQGVQACSEDDIEYCKWQIVLVNAQVLLKGCETRGYVILSAAKSEISQRIHAPVWKDRRVDWRVKFFFNGHLLFYKFLIHPEKRVVLVNAQVLLKGCETRGYVILSAAKSEISQRIHAPVWKDRTLVSKTTWIGMLECMQYYATVNAGESDTLDENIMWLTVDNIQEKDTGTDMTDIPQVPNIVGSGVSVGGVVSDTVGGSSIGDDSPIQLQRIVSRCKCEFFYADYGDISVDIGAMQDVPPPPQEELGPWDRGQSAVDAFTLMHHDLDVCTNSLQYAMILDIVNNLLLYVEPHRKEALERLARKKFQLQLQSVQDQRKPIQELQTQVRNYLCRLRRLEKDLFLVNKSLLDDIYNEQLQYDVETLEKELYACKAQLNEGAEELDMMLSCYKEFQLLAISRLATTRNDKPLTMVRANEICFKHAQWRLTEADGQIGIADLVLSNFLYTKNSKSDDSVEHLLELGYLRMTNLLPNPVYREVLCPTEIQSNMPVEHKRVLRIFCREKPPVGGISVKEHFEINVVPLTIGLTKRFYKTMMKFCFPERDADNMEPDRAGEDVEGDSKGKKIKAAGKRARETNFYVHIDDVEKMKERAEKNKLFIYIKFPEVPVRLSYKGSKEKNLEDIIDIALVIPTLEYHNVTWRWLDLLMAITSDTRRVIVSQVFKQKFVKRNIGASDENSSLKEEDKAKMLFGNRQAPENKSMIKKGVSGVFKFGK